MKSEPKSSLGPISLSSATITVQQVFATLMLVCSHHRTRPLGAWLWRRSKGGQQNPFVICLVGMGREVRQSSQDLLNLADSEKKLDMCQVCLQTFEILGTEEC